MKRKAYLINSTVILLIIPLMLLLATYEDVSSQIIFSQSERMQVERTYRVVSYIELDLQRAMEISGKRALVTVVDYIVSTGDFLDPRNNPANVTIRDLILFKEASGVSQAYVDEIMKDQTLKKWLINVSTELKKQGYTMEIGGIPVTDLRTMSDSEVRDLLVSNVDITVAPLDSFRIVIRTRLKNVKIYDLANNVIYEGPIPRKGYVYSLISIQDLEDPMFSALTKGKYFRSIQPCNYTYPELIDRPIKVLYGNGVSNRKHVVGIYKNSPDLDYIFFGSSYPNANAHAYVLKSGSPTDGTPFINGTSLQPGSDPVNPADVIKNDDLGVLIFEGVSDGGGGSSNWCSGLQYRLNITITNNAGEDLDDYQIPVLLSSAKDLTTQILDFLFSNTNYSGSQDPFKNGAAIEIYDENCNPIPFWIEYWLPRKSKALIWIRDSLKQGESKTYSIYFGDGKPRKGYEPEQVFLFFDDFTKPWTENWEKVDDTPTQSGDELTIPGDDSSYVVRTKKTLDYGGSFAIRFRMRGTKNGDWDSGVGIDDVLGQSVMFTDDYSGSGEGMAIHLVGWWLLYVTGDSGRSDITTFNTYEAQIVPLTPFIKFSIFQFRDVLDKDANALSRQSRATTHTLGWTFGSPQHIYLVTDTDWVIVPDTVFDYVVVRKHPSSGDLLDDPNFNGIRVSSPQKLRSDIEEKPEGGNTATVTSSKAYDLQPFVECVMDMRYFGTYSGWSLFERLENSNENHDRYFRLAMQMQDELGIKYGDRYYPIGLVSFMVPYRTYDEKLYNLFTNMQKTPEEGVSSVDYNFLNYYFNDERSITGEGYRVWGMSYADPDDVNTVLGNPLEVPFFMDSETATAIFGTEGANDLLKR